METWKKESVKISVITVCFNAETEIEKTIKSVLGQSYGNVEYVIVDGKSKDDTVDIIQEYAQKYPIKYLSEKDKGIYDAMNKGVKLCTGDYIVFENAGDVFYDKHVIRDFVKRMKKSKNAIYYGNWVKLIEPKPDVVMENRGKLRALLRGSMPCHQAVFAARELLVKYPFDCSYAIRSDYDWLLRCKKRGAQFCYLNRFVCVFDGDGVSMKKSNKRVLDRETQRSIKENFPLLYKFRYMIR